MQSLLENPSLPPELKETLRKDDVVLKYVDITQVRLISIITIIINTYMQFPNPIHMYVCPSIIQYSMKQY